MKTVGVLVVLLFAFPFTQCNQYGERFKNEIKTTDSLSAQLNRSVNQYVLIDTGALVQMYNELLETEKYAGLSLDYHLISVLKKEIRETLSINRHIKKDIYLTLARLKAFKQSLRHNEYDSLTFSSYLNREKNHVSLLLRNMETTANKMEYWIVHSDSLFSSLHKKN